MRLADFHREASGIRRPVPARSRKPRHGAASIPLRRGTDPAGMVRPRSPGLRLFIVLALCIVCGAWAGEGLGHGAIPGGQQLRLNSGRVWAFGKIVQVKLFDSPICLRYLNYPIKLGCLKNNGTSWSFVKNCYSEISFLSNSGIYALAISFRPSGRQGSYCLRPHPCRFIRKILHNNLGEVIKLRQLPSYINCRTVPRILESDINFGEGGVLENLQAEMQPRPMGIQRNSVRFLHGYGSFASILHRFSSQGNLSPDQKRADAGDYAGEDRGDEHTKGPGGLLFLRDQIPQSVWVGLGGLGLWLCHSGFVWGGRFFDRGRDVAAFLTVACLAPCGGFLGAFSLAVWLSN
jgi:hypothetical protein